MSNEKKLPVDRSWRIGEQYKYMKGQWLHAR